MPQFRYEAKKGPTETATGLVEAENQRAAVARLRDMGLFPLSVVEYEGESQKDPLRHALIRISLKDRNIFFRQLANLAESGMILTRALRTLVEQTENPKLSKVIAQLREDVQKGSTFADALEQHPKLFSTMTCSMVHAGETGGMLEEVLWRIVDFGEKEEELRGKVIAALIYPIFLSIVGALAVFILITFVFPKFIAIFEEFNAVLPLPTRIVMAICDFMDHWWWAVLIGLGVAIFAGINYRKTSRGRHQWDSFLLSIPVLRTVIQKYEMAKFARTLGTLLDNGVPVLQSLRITADTMTNVLIQDEVSTIHAGVIEGGSISESLGKTKHFSPMVVNMFAVGEESGRIGAVAKRVADAYDTEVDRAVKTLTSLFEPLLIVVMGVIIGFLVIAMLMPMLTLSANIGA